MKKAGLILLTIFFVLIISSCVTLSDGSGSQFSLKPTVTASEIGLLRGSVSYGAGFYFPTTSDILDISMLKTDGTTDSDTEISHRRIFNLLNFPIQFTVSYDRLDIAENDTCTIIVTLLVGGKVKAQGLTLLIRTDIGFADASLTLLSV